MYLTKDIYNNTESFIAEMPKKQRKEYGQFFTVPSTADFMASLASIVCTLIFTYGIGLFASERTFVNQKITAWIRR